MRLLHDQVIATTNFVNGIAVPRDALLAMCEQIPIPWLMNNSHDMSRPPIGRAIAKRFADLPDGSSAILCDIEVLDEDAFTLIGGGMSIAFIRNRISPVLNVEPAVEILGNPTYFSASDLEDLVRLSSRSIRIDACELIQRGFDPPFILILKFATVTFFSGFLAKAGADTWTSLRKAIADLGSKKGIINGSELTVQSTFDVTFGATTLEVVVNTPISAWKAVEGDLDFIAELQDQLLVLMRKYDLKRVVFQLALKPRAWRLEHCILSNGQTIRPEGA